MKKYTIAALLVLGTFGSNNAYGFIGELKEVSFQSIEKQYDKNQLNIDPLHFKVGRIEVEEIETPALDQSMIEAQELESFLTELDSKNDFVESAGALATIGQVILKAEKIIAIGEKVWAIIEKGRPVTKFNMGKTIKIIPEGMKTRDAFYQMSGWSAPKTKTLKYTYKNVYGMEMAAFTYTIAFQHSGQHDGRGSYITGANVFARQVYAFYGVTVEANAELASIANVGSHDNPVASAMIQIKHKAATIVTDNNATDVYYMDGRGTLQKMQ